jgi:hypothetical protein
VVVSKVVGLTSDGWWWSVAGSCCNGRSMWRLLLEELVSSIE